MKRSLPFTLLCLLLSFAMAQVTPSLYPDPLATRISNGPLIEEHYIDGELYLTRQYDENGLLVSAQWHRGNATRYVGTAVIKHVDTEQGIITFTGRIPEGMNANMLRGPNAIQAGKVHDDDRSRFELIIGAFARDFTPGETVKVGVSEPFNARYTYPPNQVIEERLWQDGTPFETTTYHYGRHGPTSVQRTDHQNNQTHTIATYEYDERGNLTRDDSLSVGIISNYRFHDTYQYDHQGRLTRKRNEVWGGETTITYPPAPPGVTRAEMTGNNAITTLTYDHTNNTLEFETTDYTRANPLRSTDLGLLLESLGINTPRHYSYLRLDTFARGRLVLDDQNRITHLTAYQPANINGVGAAWLDITTTFDPHQETTTITLTPEPAGTDYPLTLPPQNLTLTTRPPTE